jgi:hypothetical protein
LTTQGFCNQQASKGCHVHPQTVRRALDKFFAADIHRVGMYRVLSTEVAARLEAHLRATGQLKPLPSATARA